MANYAAIARTNYFPVKDPEAFRAEMQQYEEDVDVEVVTKDDTFALISTSYHGGWPTERYSEDADDYVEVDLPGVVSQHLVEGHVAMFLEVGAEKLRYLNAWGVAINSAGERIDLNLEDELAERAKALGNHITDAST